MRTWRFIINFMAHDIDCGVIGNDSLQLLHCMTVHASSFCVFSC